MAIETMSRERIDGLNARALALMADYSDEIRACEAAADEAGLVYVDGDDQCSILRDPAADEYVNLWTEGQMTTAIADGGVGFDGQIDWWIEEQASRDD